MKSVLKMDLNERIALVPSKGSTLKEKNLLPLGANAFLLEQPVFRRGHNSELP